MGCAIYRLTADAGSTTEWVDGTDYICPLGETIFRYGHLDGFDWYYKVVYSKLNEMYRCKIYTMEAGAITWSLYYDSEDVERPDAPYTANYGSDLLLVGVFFDGGLRIDPVYGFSVSAGWEVQQNISASMVRIRRLRRKDGSIIATHSVRYKNGTWNRVNI